MARPSSKPTQGAGLVRGHLTPPHRQRAPFRPPPRSSRARGPSGPRLPGPRSGRQRGWQQERAGTGHQKKHPLCPVRPLARSPRELTNSINSVFHESNHVGEELGGRGTGRERQGLAPSAGRWLLVLHPPSFQRTRSRPSAAARQPLSRHFWPRDFWGCSGLLRSASPADCRGAVVALPRSLDRRR